MRDGTVDDVARALYEERTLLRVMAMRRTMFVVDRATAPVVHPAASRGVAAQERRRLMRLLAEAGVADDLDAWLAGAEEAALASLRARGEATAPEVASDDPRLATELVLGAGTRYETRQKVASRVLLVLGTDGRVIRARPRGGWTSTQFRWATTEGWCDGVLAPMDPAEAEAELARRWLRAFGPATAADLQWWAGWPAGRTRRALDAAGAVAVDLHGEPGVALPDDLEPTPQPAPWVALLPALDATPMGYKQRGFYLGAHAERVFDRNGNVGPTVWADGRIVGGWAQRPDDGEVVVGLLEDVGAEVRAAIDAEAAALTARLGDVRLAPRARGYTPVERELLGR